ncbi:MAG: hypothetical protein FD134_1479 [Gallionellaceae bacterium]|nr:MAG: hypothetical protein FD134_1479 [Gallionellaceae bacterium]
MMRRPSTRSLPPSHPGGFTLIEMIAVIVLTGLIAGVVALFIRAPVQGYVDSARRAEMADIADTTLRRVTRDLRLALPNSVVVTNAGTQVALDFLSTSGGGRYRASGTGAGGCGAAGDSLDFAAADTCFEITGPAVNFQAGDQVVVYNLGAAGANAYSGYAAPTDVRRAYDVATGGTGPRTVVRLLSTSALPFESPSQRFHVVNEQVRYLCDTATGNLTRYWGFAIAAPPATPTVPAGGNNALLASRISACSFAYNANVVTQRAGLVTMLLTVTSGGESVSLYNATHVSNVP